ncbi:response regulator [Desulfobacula sp.]
MIHILLVSREKNIFKDFQTALLENEVTFDWTDSAQKALSKLSKEKFDLLITHEQLPDMAGRELVEKVLFKNAMINSVVLSALSHEDFHETYEGFGVLMQFPLVPGKEQAEKLLDHLNRIAQIASRTSKSGGKKI